MTGLGNWYTRLSFCSTRFFFFLVCYIAVFVDGPYQRGGGIDKQEVRYRKGIRCDDFLRGRRRRISLLLSDPFPSLISLRKLRCGCLPWDNQSAGFPPIDILEDQQLRAFRLPTLFFVSFFRDHTYGVII